MELLSISLLLGLMTDDDSQVHFRPTIKADFGIVIEIVTTIDVPAFVIICRFITLSDAITSRTVRTHQKSLFLVFVQMLTEPSYLNLTRVSWNFQGEPMNTMT